MKDKTKKKMALTENQKQFAAENHHLIEKFLRYRGLPMDEFYDVVMFRFLRAVQQYDERDELKQHVARTTKGKTLLSGNIYCAHCGNTLTSSENIEKYTKKDGTIGVSKNLRYLCYHRANKLCDCDGQSVYSANIVDKIVLDIVETYLKRIKTTPKDKALEIRYQKEISAVKRIQRELTDKRERLKQRLNELSLEVGRCLNHESSFTIDVLSMSIDSTKLEIKDVEKKLNECNNDLDKQSNVLNKLDHYYQQFVSWAEEFENAILEQRKMILCQLIKAVRVGKGSSQRVYNIDIEFNISYQQFFDN